MIFFSLFFLPKNREKHTRETSRTDLSLMTRAGCQIPHFRMRFFSVSSGSFLISPGRSHSRAAAAFLTFFYLFIFFPHERLSPSLSLRTSERAHGPGFDLHLRRATCCSWPGGRCVSSKENPLHSVTVAARTAVLPLRCAALCQNGDREPSGPSQLSAGETGGGRRGERWQKTTC